LSVQKPAQFLNCGFTQEIGIALAGLGKFDASLGGDPVGEIVSKAKGYASLFKRDTQNSLGFGIDIEVVHLLD